MIYVYHSSRISKAGNYIYIKLFCYNMSKRRIEEKRIKLDQYTFVPADKVKPSMITNGKTYTKYKSKELLKKVIVETTSERNEILKIEGAYTLDNVITLDIQNLIERNILYAFKAPSGKFIKFSSVKPISITPKARGICYHDIEVRGDDPENDEFPNADEAKYPIVSHGFFHLGKLYTFYLKRDEDYLEEERIFDALEAKYDFKCAWVSTRCSTEKELIVKSLEKIN